MDTPRPTIDRKPLGDLTNTPHQKPLEDLTNEQKSERDRERYSGGVRIDLDNNINAHLIGMNSINETDENSHWLHRQSTYNGPVPLSSIFGTADVDDTDTEEDNIIIHESDGPAPSSSILGTADVDDTDIEEDNIIIHESGPINQLVKCPKERKRDYDRERNAAMSPNQRALLSKRKRESYASKTAAKKLEMAPKETAQSTDGLVPLTIGVPGDIDERLIETGAVRASSSVDNIATCPKERKRERERPRRAAMSPGHKAQMNKRRRELYAVKNTTKKLQMTPQEKKLKRKESKDKYNRTVKEHRANNLHPDSIAMESPHFNPQIIFPSPQLPKATSHNMEIPELMGMPVHIAPAVVQTPEVQEPELTAAHTIHRHRVTPGERSLLMSRRRNQAFEANIGRRPRGCAVGKCDDATDPTQPSVVYNDGVTQESPVPPPDNCTGTQTQPSVVDGTSPMPPNGAQVDTPDDMVEDDYDADVIFEDDEEEEAYFFAGQGTP